MYKCLSHNKVPSYLSQKFKLEAQDRLTMQNLDLRIPKCRLTMGQRLFVFRGAKIQWKGLPKDLKST